MNRSICPGHYALDRVESGLAVLQLLETTKQNHTSITVPLWALCAHLPAGKSRPADGTVFFCDEMGQWYPDPAATVRRQKLLRQKLCRLTAPKENDNSLL